MTQGELTDDEHFQQIEVVTVGRVILTGEGAGTHVPAGRDLYCRAHNVKASQQPEHFSKFGEQVVELLKRGD